MYWLIKGSVDGGCALKEYPNQRECWRGWGMTGIGQLKGVLPEFGFYKYCLVKGSVNGVWVLQVLAS